MVKNKKSDVSAKLKFKEKLELDGYQNVAIKASPSDIIAEKDGITHYFEIKMTKSKGKCFGAATLTEWKQALKTPDYYKFVIVKTNEEETDFEFILYTPSEFMSFSTIPPFKFYFNIDFNESIKKSKITKAIKLSESKINHLIKEFDNLKMIID